MAFLQRPGGNRIVTIGEYNNLEEYSQSLQSPPVVAGYMYHESTPLIEADEKVLKAYVESYKAAK